MAIRSSVLPLEEGKASFCCNELELSTDDISVRGDCEEGQWTEVLPSKDDYLETKKGATRSLSKAKLSPQRNRKQQQPPSRSQVTHTLLPHAISVPNIEILLAKKEPPMKSSKKIAATLSHPLEVPVATPETEDESEGSSDEDEDRQDQHMSSSSYGRISRDLRDLRNTNDVPHRLRIIDARPMMNAKGNALMGKGHEIIGRLGGDSCTTLDFADIPNIHVVRDSLGALRRVIGEASGNPNWFQLIHDTKWLLYISLILKGAIRVALHLESGEPVLVHCSDGWDRTSQLTALAQLILSPNTEPSKVLLFSSLPLPCLPFSSLTFPSLAFPCVSLIGCDRVQESNLQRFQFLWSHVPSTKWCS
jgi:hypothetical protein